MKLIEVINRKSIPEPWEDGDNIPWHEPDFSKRMLAEHLSQSHDMASRRFEIIDKHVDWIHTTLLKSHNSKILDLCCGPGFYTNRLAQKGHKCTGIDYSPASIEYAKDQAKKAKSSDEYLFEDIREADFGSDNDLVTMIFGEFNVFHPDEAKSILLKVNQSLAKEGILLFEPHTFSATEGIGKEAASWSSHETGLFSNRPHILLKESFWNETSKTSSNRYFLLDLATSEVQMFGATYQAYINEEYISLLESIGFGDIKIHTSLGGIKDGMEGKLLAITAVKS